MILSNEKAGKAGTISFVFDTDVEGYQIITAWGEI